MSLYLTLCFKFGKLEHLRYYSQYKYKDINTLAMDSLQYIGGGKSSDFSGQCPELSGAIPGVIPVSQSNSRNVILSRITISDPGHSVAPGP